MSPCNTVSKEEQSGKQECVYLQDRHTKARTSRQPTAKEMRWTGAALQRSTKKRAQRCLLGRGTQAYSFNQLTASIVATSICCRRMSASCWSTFTATVCSPYSAKNTFRTRPCPTSLVLFASISCVTFAADTSGQPNTFWYQVRKLLTVVARRVCLRGAVNDDVLPPPAAPVVVFRGRIRRSIYPRYRDSSSTQIPKG